MALKKDTAVDHFVATHLGMVMRTPDVYRWAITIALCTWDFVKEDREFVELKKRGLGLDGIAAITGMSESKAKAVLHKMATSQPPEVEKIHGRRDLGERTSWRLIAPHMRWAEAKRLLTVRLPQVRTLKGQLPLLDTIQPPDGQTVLDRPATTNQASGAVVAGSPPQKSSTNIKEIRPSTKTLKTDLPADAGGAELPPAWKRLRAHFASFYYNAHKKDLSHIKQDWVRNSEDLYIEQHGLDEMRARVANYFSNPNRTSHSYQVFLSKIDEWSEPWAELYKVKDDYAPKRRRRAAQDMLDSMGLGGDDDEDDSK